MNDKLVGELSNLLKLDKSVLVEALQKEDGDESVLKDYKSNYQAYTKDEVATLISNSNKSYLEKADFDINEVPKNLYNKVAGAVLESREKAIAKEYGIENYSDLNGLVKAISSKNISETKTSEVAEDQIKALQEKTVKLEEHFNNEKNKIKSQYDSELIKFHQENAFNKLKGMLNYDDTKDDSGISQLDTHIGLYQDSFKARMRQEVKDGKVVTYDTSTGELLTNKLGDPLTPFEATKTLAENLRADFKKPDIGGRGSNGSDTQTNSLTGLQWGEVLSSRGIKPNTDEADKAFNEWKAANSN